MLNSLPPLPNTAQGPKFPKTTSSSSLATQP